MDRLQRFGTQGPISFSLAPKLFGMQKGRDKEKKGRSKALGRSGVAFDAAGTDPDGLDLIEDPERYTNQVFARDTIEKVKATYESLEKQSERGTVALKQNVYENYPVLISTSRAIAEMEADMLDVRNCLQEFQATVKGLQQTSLVPPKFSEATDVSTSKDSSQRPSATTSSKVLAELSKLMDDLDVLIKIRKYSGAVDLLSSGRKTLKELNASITQAIMNEKTMQLDHMEQVLIEFIAKDLRNPTITKSEMRKFIAFLQKLEQEPMARDLYLKSRSDWIKREVRYIKFSGDILSYASELSRITFAAIASTCKEFTSCFPDKLVFSSFITWAVNEVHDFGASFNRQVFHSDNFGVMARCTEIPKIHCKQLQLLGVDLLPTLEPIFTPSISEAITVFMNNFKSSLSKQMEDEVWLPKDCTIKEDGIKQNALTVKLTDSGRFLVTTTIGFLNDIKPLTSIKLYAPLVSSLVGIIDWYLIKLNEFTLDAMTDQQVMGLLTTVSAILGPCMKRFEDEVVVLFARPVPDFRALSDTHSDLLKGIQTSFVSSRAETAVVDIFGDDCLSRSKSELGENFPSKKAVQFFSDLASLEKAALSSMHNDAVLSLLRVYMDNFFEHLSQESPIFDPSKLYKSGPIHQIWIDLVFIAKAFKKLLTLDTKEKAEEVLTKYEQTYGSDELCPRDRVIENGTKALSMSQVRLQSL